MKPPESKSGEWPGWGKIHGDHPRFTPIANDILAALFHVQVNALERRLIGYVLHWSWGEVVRNGKIKGRFPDAQPCHLDVPALAEAWGVSRTHLSDARASLIADNILAPLADGFTFNKNVDSWGDGRISEVSREFARSVADSPPIGHRNGRTATVRKRATTVPPGGQSTAATVRKRATTVPPGGQSTAATVPKRATTVPQDGQESARLSLNGQPLSPLADSHSPKADSRADCTIGTRASEEFKKIKEENTDRQTAGGRAGEDQIPDPEIRAADGWTDGEPDLTDEIVTPLDPVVATLPQDEIPATREEPARPRLVPEDERLDDEAPGLGGRSGPEDDRQ
jgi:hypothetical protein